MQKYTSKAARKVLDAVVLRVLPAKLANRILCSRDSLWERYFEEAEKTIDREWNEIIWPLIEDFDFTSVLELAPGVGRITARLARVSKVIYAVDINKSALEKCKQRLGSSSHGCEIYYYRNSGSELTMIEDGSITTIFCWDSAVHFDKLVLRDYIAEFARVLTHGGRGFVHHSNLGDEAERDIRKNPHWRSNMSKDLFREYCEAHKLKVILQKDVAWAGGDIYDCISVFVKAPQ